jgi:hypothetical protein
MAGAPSGGRGFATATTPADFLPHCEQRSRGARDSSEVDQPRRQADQGPWLDLTRGSARQLTRPAAIIQAAEGPF